MQHRDDRQRLARNATSGRNGLNFSSFQFRRGGKPISLQVSTLRFASRMMCVPAEPTVNEVIDPVKAIENYKRENKYLRDELAVHDKLLNRHGASYEPLTDQQLQDIDTQCRRFVDGSLDEIEVQNLRQVQGTCVRSRPMETRIPFDPFSLL